MVKASSSGSLGPYVSTLYVSYGSEVTNMHTYKPRLGDTNREAYSLIKQRAGHQLLMISGSYAGVHALYV